MKSGVGVDRSRGDGMHRYQMNAQCYYITEEECKTARLQQEHFVLSQCLA